MIRSQWHITGERRPGSVREVLEILLENRKADPSFLDGTLKDLESHLSMRGMDEAAELMARHLSAGHKLVLVGDYDCDGITSLAQVSQFFRDIEYKRFEVVIPSRSEGYGVPERAVFEHPDAELFVTLDCGTLDVKAISMARSRGADCIVIDHHEVPDGNLAPATVLVNPKHPDCPSAFKEFCSAGLTLLFLARLRKALRNRFRTPSLGGKYLALAAIGTVADLVPLVGANRILARSGLSSINTNVYEPVRQIADSAGLGGKKITAGHLGFYVGPRINAAGRVADARLAFDLLMAEGTDETCRLAQELNRYNTKRQQQEDAILTEIRERFAGTPAGRRTLVMGDAAWPAGVIGIVASRVQQEFCYGPVVIFSVDEQAGIARGSARSVPGFDIHRALHRCGDLMLRWGGHKMAAGMTLDVRRLPEFAERLEQVALEQPPEVFVPNGRVDMELAPDLIRKELLEALKQLEPHGLGNPTPTFALRDAKVSVRKIFGREQNHARLHLNAGVEGIFWRGAESCQSLSLDAGSSLDVVFQLEWDDYSGKPVLIVKDMGKFF
ncbi:MAG: single-stranded-DNA-specific exonuclease RecJ [Syntrophobacteraceae bacterium]|nr:single-stranded-DNA-specific exonuclease RecJ [Desulfobacteraceae bacterium]